jgi:hypothetical protein
MGWSGLLAGVFAFVVMGAIMPCTVEAATPAHVHAEAHVHEAAAEAGHHHFDHDLASAGHVHAPADHGHAGDGCKDGCCGSACFGLTGPDVAASYPVTFSGYLYRALSEPMVERDNPFRLERPPRA